MASPGTQGLVVGVVLSGGLSSRMGQDKGKLILGEQTLLTQACSLLIESGLQLTLISSNDPAQGIVDRFANCGPLGGMHSIFCHLREGGINVAGVLFIAVDMPEITNVEISELVRKGKLHGQPVCFEETNLPLYLPFTPEIYTYLERAVNGQASRSVHALIETFHGLQVANVNRKNFININTPCQWQEYSTHKMTQEK